ncbi:MgtC/SapB family protein [Bacteroides sp.]|uniref:MgtC/SapB family protein n=1 Tax=Bacteroides sp. TaxID=29523 RepID=UPI003AB691D2
MTVFVSKIAIALFLGALIGMERQWRQCAAGLRTNALVALGAAIFMVMASEIGGQAQARIASYIVSGIGFLGAGVILKDGASIRGLNTAATLWCTAAIGAFCGLGYLIEPVIGTAFILGVHILLRPLANIIRRRAPINKIESEEYNYRFTVLCREQEENHIRTLFMQYLGNNDMLLLKSVSSSDTTDPSVVLVDVDILSFTTQDQSMEKIASFLTLEKGVLSVKWELA